MTQRHYFTAQAILLHTLLFTTLAANTPPKLWSKNSKGFTVDTAGELDSLVDHGGTQFILLEFFSQNCIFCYEFQEAWNDLHDDFEDWFGD